MIWQLYVFDVSSCLTLLYNMLVYTEFIISVIYSKHPLEHSI
jgi:hypothetical protein